MLDENSAGEIYVDPGENFVELGSPFRPESRLDTVQCVLIRTARAGNVTGRLYWPKPDASGMAVLKFSIPASAADTKAKTAFYQAKEDHYNRLLAASIPGGAWFRHEVRQAQAALYKTPQGVSAETRRPMWDPNSPHNSELVETYSLFSGGRAVSENLQLDRTVQGTKPEEGTIDVDTIDGITVPEIDWKPLVKDCSRNSTRWRRRFPPTNMSSSFRRSPPRCLPPIRRTFKARRSCTSPNHVRKTLELPSVTSGSWDSRLRG